MNARRAAGWIALVSGALLVLGIAGSAIAATTGLANVSGTGWTMPVGMMGNGRVGMMGNGMMSGYGMMGFGTSGPASTAVPNAPEVKIQAANFSFSPSDVHLPKNANVNLTFTNPAATGVVHDFTVPALGIHIVANPGETKTVGLHDLPSGHYDAYCSIPGHADLGMRGTVTVE